METLTTAQVKFDPTTCLDRPLFVSNVIEGPAPLWERFGIKFGGGGGGGSSSSNLQGQQYRYTRDEMSVINYAEVFGRAFHVRAYGTYEREGGSSANVDGADSMEVSPSPTSSPLADLLSFFGGKPQQSNTSSSNDLIQCPTDFTVTVTKGSFHIFGHRLDVPISGTGYLRVLYADPNIRIFVSPKSTTDDRWEKAGLKVAQIRVDLVRRDGFEDLFEE